MSSKQYNVEQDKALIECIATYPVLFDRSNADYKNQTLKENIWAEISSKLRRTPVDCKKRWRSIRDTFMKLRRNNKCGTGTAGRPKSKWPLLNHMSFFNDVPFDRHWGVEVSQETSDETIKMFRETSSSTEMPLSTILETDFDYNVGHNIKRESDSPMIARKRHKKNADRPMEMVQKRVEVGKKLVHSHDKSIVEDNDPLLTFFKSMAMTVKTFPPSLITEAKRRVFNIINELENKSIQGNLL